MSGAKQRWQHLSLCKSLRKCSPSEDIFVATPHRVQRQAVKAALKSVEDDELADALQSLNITTSIPESGKVTVDTVEKLQGQVSRSF